MLLFLVTILLLKSRSRTVVEDIFLWDDCTLEMSEAGLDLHILSICLLFSIDNESL